jgi:hypothetical protein
MGLPGPKDKTWMSALEKPPAASVELGKRGESSIQIQSSKPAGRIGESPVTIIPRAGFFLFEEIVP